MRRFARFVVGAAGGLALAGCTPTGTYQVSWNFFPRADGTGDVQSAAEACGQHGVDAILVKGTSGGNGSAAVGLCTRGQLSGSVAPGSWMFEIDMLDVRGTVLPGGVTTATMTLSDGMTTTFPTVTIIPISECHDGIDNDGDGLVDGDDPGCANATDDPNDPTTESTPGVSPPDGGASDGAVPDGSVPDGSAPDGLAPDAPPADASVADGPAPDVGGSDDGGSDAGAPDDAATGG